MASITTHTAGKPPPQLNANATPNGRWYYSDDFSYASATIDGLHCVVQYNPDHEGYDWRIEDEAGAPAASTT